MKTIGLLTLVILIADNISAQRRSMTCIEDYKCVSLSKCRRSTAILYPCSENQTLVCCPPDQIIEKTNASPAVIRTSAFPTDCGTVFPPTGGEIASVGQFPWIALLGYGQAGLDLAQFLCAGSIITQKFILTAAHCLTIDVRLKLEIVRIGELDLATFIDCNKIGTEIICARPYVDIGVDKTIPHENFDRTNLANDIALIKLKEKITFTAYVQPVCLPFQNDINYKIIVNDKLTVSGWGKIDTEGLHAKLMYAQVYVWDRNKCNAAVPPKIRPVRESQLCANGAKREDACKGDSGGPLTNITRDNADIRNYQIGIVSFASARVCGNAELPTIYTKVDYYLDWIVTNLK